MTIQILMPALSPTMTEGKITRWLKKEGDTVKAGQTIAEIETDKATMEVEAVDEGKLGKILIPAGTEHVAVNTPIAVLLEEGESAGDIKKSKKPSPASAGKAGVGTLSRGAGEGRGPSRSDGKGEGRPTAPVASASLPGEKNYDKFMKMTVREA